MVDSNIMAEAKNTGNLFKGHVMNRNTIIKFLLLAQVIFMGSEASVYAVERYTYDRDEVCIRQDKKGYLGSFDRFVEWIIARGIFPVAVMYAGGHIGALVSERVCGALVSDESNAVTAIVQGFINGALFPLCYGAIESVSEPASADASASLIRFLVRGFAWKTGIANYYRSNGCRLISCCPEERVAGSLLGATMSLATYNLLHKMYISLIQKNHLIYEIDYSENEA